MQKLSATRPPRPKMKVAQALAERILRGDYKPGKPIPAEGLLLSEFGVSRTCMREALQVLGAKGLVFSRPRLGTVVTTSIHWNFLDADVLRWRQSIVDRKIGRAHV